MEDPTIKPDTSILLDIVRMPMPYGKYKGTLIKHVPTYYLEWMSTQGFPAGRLGMILSTAFIIKTHGLEYLLKDIR
ncbi:MAG: DUF3820 family protein [Saprospiraceae bacterium]|jgi:uncharacterized protein (DUF3820 family)|nr:DUF3820 family protein [Saprospiraceae bacterium]MBK8826680.1 DUF3820 family protein [Saprospiraceae bacterium]MBK8885858.1 DUF3820 family protein [Saprospiraceae bacterium]MBK9581790.1 DUF3820 family protein [Saprospiraceae bacterium]MBK9743350.1 DUF3820 family protein [Saprospiraceae bacterium]